MVTVADVIYVHGTPRGVHTKMIQIKREDVVVREFLTPEEVSEVVAWLLDSAPQTEEAVAIP